MNISQGNIALKVALYMALAMPAGVAVAQDIQSVIGQRVASVTYGPYLRLEFGHASPSTDDGYWQPPGFPGDPQVNFDLDASGRSFSSVGIGFDWQNGYRGDISVLATGSTSVSGPCSNASDATPCSTHADISGASLKTRALMGSVFYAPLEQRALSSVFQPFVVAGLGLARNQVGPWTRENPTATRPIRTFSGDTTTNIAWSLGLGASWQVTRPGKWPVIVEASWRYYDFGDASGGTIPSAGSGSSEPVQPLTFKSRDQVLSIGVRIPLKRY